MFFHPSKQRFLVLFITASDCLCDSKMPQSLEVFQCKILLRDYLLCLYNLAVDQGVTCRDLFVDLELRSGVLMVQVSPLSTTFR